MLSPLQRNAGARLLRCSDVEKQNAEGVASAFGGKRTNIQGVNIEKVKEACRVSKADTKQERSLRYILVSVLSS